MRSLNSSITTISSSLSEFMKGNDLMINKRMLRALLPVVNTNGTGDSDDTGNAVAVDANGNVMVAGYSFGATYDLVTIQYGFIRPPLNVRQTTSSIVLSWTNSAFMPHPALMRPSPISPAQRVPTRIF